MSNKKSIDHAFTATGLRGAASDPTYAGALSFMRRKYTKDTDGADLVVWGIPFDAAVSHRPGTRFGPQAIRAASASFDNDRQYPFHLDLFEEMAVIDYGDCLLDYGRHWQTPLAIQQQASAILDSGAYLLSLGGDHFVTWPLLQAHAKRHGQLALVQFDAHQDTWDDDGERIDHGTFVARAVRDGVIDANRSIQIGIRTHAPADFGIEIIYGNELEETPMRQIAQQIAARVGDGPVYVTFDIDFFDPSTAPGTGTPVAGGPSSAKGLGILRRLSDLNIVGSDVVEVSPPYDGSDITAIAAANVAMYMVGLRAEKFSNR